MSVLSETVRRQIFEVLSTDLILNELTPGDFHHQVAPQGTASPFVVYFRSSNLATYAFANNLVFEKDLWMIKALAESDAASSVSPEQQVEDVLSRIDTLLNGMSFTLEGATILLMRRIGDITPYIEQVSADQVVHHHGSMYEVTINNG